MNIGLWIITKENLARNSLQFLGFEILGAKLAATVFYDKGLEF